jgi:hypothetical protein
VILTYRPDLLDCSPTPNKVSDEPPTYVFAGYTLQYVDNQVLVTLDDGRQGAADFFVTAYHMAHQQQLA